MTEEMFLCFCCIFKGQENLEMDKNYFKLEALNSETDRVAQFVELLPLNKKVAGSPCDLCEWSLHVLPVMCGFPLTDQNVHVRLTRNS